MKSSKTQIRPKGVPDRRGPRESPSEAACGRANRQPSDGIPQKWRKQYQSLLALRERLQLDRQNRCAALQQPMEAFSMDMADAATDEFEHGLAVSELSAHQDVLYEIEGALRRIQNNTYGICEISGKPIAAARLRAIPWTRFAGSVEAQLEKDGSVRRTQLGELRSIAGESGPELPANDSATEPVPNEEVLSRTSPIPGVGPSRREAKQPRSEARAGPSRPARTHAAGGMQRK